MLDKLAPEVDPDNLVTVLQNLEKTDSKIMVSNKLTELTENSVVVEDVNTGEKTVVPADTVILSVGNCPNSRLYQELLDTYQKVYLLGDSKQVGRVANAVHTAYQAAYTME